MDRTPYFTPIYGVRSTFNRLGPRKPPRRSPFSPGLTCLIGNVADQISNHDRFHEVQVFLQPHFRDSAGPRMDRGIADRACCHRPVANPDTTGVAMRGM